MRFVLHGEALNGPDENLGHIDRLVDRVADELHRVELPDADQLQESRWYQGARRIRQQLLTSAATAPVRRNRQHGLHAKSFEVRSPTDVQTAQKLAHTPLTIVVEDEEADGSMLNVFIEELGSEEMRLLYRVGKAVSPRAIEYYNAGGVGSMPARIERLVSKACEEKRPVRAFVVCDGDQRWPGDTAFETARDIASVRDVCARYGIAVHVLAKRNAENYLPDTVFEALRDRRWNDDERRPFDALLRRTREQRDHFPLRKGLKPKQRQIAIEQGLYRDSEMADLQLLEASVLPSLPTVERQAGDASGKSKRHRPWKWLPEQHRDAFTAASLRARDGRGEIDQLLSAISEEL